MESGAGFGLSVWELFIIFIVLIVIGAMVVSFSAGQADRMPLELPPKESAPAMPLPAAPAEREGMAPVIAPAAGLV